MMNLINESSEHDNGLSNRAANRFTAYGRARAV